jgi:hypothetical protein
MTKKHFIALAAMLRDQYNALKTDAQKAQFTSYYNDIERFCARQNAQFDANRFHAAVFGGKS